jgi:hypothetical protein
MAWRPPINPKSTPYWKGEKIITPQAMKTFQWALQLSALAVVILKICASTVERREGVAEKERGKQEVSCEISSFL